MNPRSSFRLAPTLKVADRTIRESHTRGTQRMTVRQIVEYSSNIGTITIAQRLGEGRLASWIDRFGFGKSTGIDFPGESAGFALPLDQWSGSTIGTVPIGHGIAVTPVQMARAYSVIANGGRLVRPHLIDRIDGSDVATRSGRRVVSRAVAEQMLSMLRGVVVEGTGTAGCDPRIHGGRQDGNRGEDRPERPLLDVAVRRVVRRPRAGVEAGARGHGHGRRAARGLSTAATSPRRRSARSRASTSSTSRFPQDAAEDRAQTSSDAAGAALDCGSL